MLKNNYAITYLSTALSAEIGLFGGVAHVLLPNQVHLFFWGVQVVLEALEGRILHQHRLLLYHSFPGSRHHNLT